VTEETTAVDVALDARRGGTDLRKRLVEILADVRDDPVDKLSAEAQTLDWQLEMDSKEAEVVIGRLEHELGRDLAKSEDLEPEQLATVEAVAALVERSLQEVPPASGHGG
jgi:acyl carrier protein